MEIQYESRIVAFVDVLGFSNLVYSATTEKISKYFSFVEGDFKDAVAKHGFRFLIISDSVVLSAPDTKESLKTTIKVLYRLQQKLLEEEGILVRGGLSWGQLHMSDTNNVIVGPGLINAYRLEASAKYPRIIVDRSLIPRHYTGTEEFVQDLYWVRYDHCLPYQSDFPFLDYGKGIGFSIQKRKLDRIIQALKDNYYKNENIDKYEWLKRYLDDSIEMSLKYLTGKTEPSKQDLTRIRLLTGFLHDLRAL